MVKIVICSAAKIYSEGLELILSQQPDLNVLDLANNIDCAVELISFHRPDILLLDVCMRNSYMLAERLASISPGTRAVAISVSDDSYFFNYVELGIQCYVQHEGSKNDLINAIREAAKGEFYCSQNIVGLLLRKMKSLIEQDNKIVQTSDNIYSASPSLSPEQQGENPLSIASLTKREHQIAKLLAQGLANKQIASELCIEVSTVKNHVHNLLVKLNAKNRCQAVLLIQNDINHKDSSSFFDPDRDMLLSSALSPVS